MSDGPAPHPMLAPAPRPKAARKDLMDLVFKVAGGTRACDVLFLMPTAAIDRRARVSVAETLDGAIATLEAEVDAHFPPGGSKAPYRVRLRDETGFITAIYFRPQPDMIRRLYPLGARRILSGKVETYNGERQMTHPDHVLDPEGKDRFPDVEPIYPLTAGLPLRTVQRAIAAALPALQDLPEWLDARTIEARGFGTFAEALARLHRPEAPADVLPEAQARTRLAYDELFLRQCALRLRRAARQRREATGLTGDGARARRLIASLPYQPTGAQARAVREIAEDLARPTPMLRLLQGDVGSGKTLVAALAMAHAAEAGAQSALMAPTEILARQHGASLLPLLAAAGLKAAVLTGRDKGKERREILAALASGELAAVVGTHALIQDEVAFRRLGLVVIDEQHRFGVSDRARLVEKGAEPHVLVMSATPIPRTLALAAHGDMDASVLDEKPPGRKPVRTVAMPLTRGHEVVDAIARAIEGGERAYWVCPLVEESSEVDLAAVADRYEALKERFGPQVELVHGRMTPAAREAAMGRFKSGEAAILVATTVIEVGVNVPEATIMVIEHAERFGLAQLHQLRGRIGRGDLPGACLLLWKPPLGETARERLDALRRNDDGFKIAEIDYKLRGAGDVLGVRQSGLPPFRFAVPEVHGDLLIAADQEARLAIDRDPALAGDRGRAIRLGLELLGLLGAAELARSG